WRRGVRCVLLVRLREVVDATDLYRAHRARLPGNTRTVRPGMYACGWSYRHAALVLRERAGLGRRSSSRLRAPAGRERRLLLGQRLAPLLREPDRESERCAF